MALQVLFRLGSPTSSQGPRSLLAFWIGGAAAVPSVTPTAVGSGSDLVYPFKGKRRPAEDASQTDLLDQATSAKQISETAIAAALRSAADTRALKAKAIELQDDLNLRLLLLMSE